MSTGSFAALPNFGWRADGKELFYNDAQPGSTVMAVPVELGGTFKYEQPRTLFTAPSGILVFTHQLLKMAAASSPFRRRMPPRREN